MATKVATEISELTLQSDPECPDNVSKVLVVYDTDSCISQDIAQVVKEQGYNPVLLKIPNDTFKSVKDFIRAFENITRPEDGRRPYVLAFFLYSTTSSTLCMYCGDYRIDSNPLLKHATAAAYCQWGRGRCAIIHPPRCCALDSSQLPAKQVEDMSIEWDIDMPNGELGKIVLPFESMKTRLASIKKKDAKTTRHVLTIQEVVPTEKEEAISLAELLRLVEPRVKDVDAFALDFGVNAIEWEELQQRSKQDALFFVLRREVTKDMKSGLHLIASRVGLLGEFELARMCRDFADESKRPLYLSDYTLDVVSEQDEGGDFLGGQNRTAILGDQPNPEDDTHLDKLQSHLLPPYIRDALQLQKEGKQEAFDELTAETIEHAQALDRAYEKRQLERELLEYQGQLPRGSTLLGGYNEREKKPGKSKK